MLSYFIYFYFHGRKKKEKTMSLTIFNTKYLDNWKIIPTFAHRKQEVEPIKEKFNYYEK